MAKTTSKKLKKIEEKVTLTLEAHPSGYSKVLTYNGKTYTENWQLTMTGSRRLSKKGIASNKEIPESIVEVVDSFAAYELMDALNSI